MAHNFDLSSRTWYVAASGKLNIAMGLEIATAVAPHWFLPLGATANAVKGLAWMAGGSSRSAFNVAFAADRNIADITAKATSQTICTSLIGTAAGMAIAASIEKSVGLAFGWYSALAAVHMYTAVESAKSVPLATLNPSRLKLLAEIILSSRDVDRMSFDPGSRNTDTDNSSSTIASSDSTVESSTGFPKEERFLSENFENLPSPAELAIQDRIFPPLSILPNKITLHKREQNTTTDSTLSIKNKNRAQHPFDLVVGTSLQKLASTEDGALLTSFLQLYMNKKYILVIDRHNRMHLVLHEEAKTVDAVAAVLQATAWNKLRQQKQQQTPSAAGAMSSNEFSNQNLQQEAQITMDLAEQLAPSMVDALKRAGWDVQGVVIEPQRRRARW